MKRNVPRHATRQNEAPAPVAGAPPAAAGETTAVPSPSPRWTDLAKLMTGLTVSALAGALVVRFHTLLQLLVIAALLAFLLVPMVRFVQRRTRFSWALTTHLVLVLLIVLLILGLATAGLALAKELQSLVETVKEFLTDLPGLMEDARGIVIVAGPFHIDLAQYDLASLADQAPVYLRPVLGEASGVVAALGGGAIETLFRMGLVVAVAYFITLDQRAFSEMCKRSFLPGYQADWDRLAAALGRIWAAFVRGQIVLGLIIAFVVTLGLSILGVRNALVLGVISGILEFVPVVGPFIAAATAALVAFFQGSNWWGLDPLIFTVVVIAFFIVVQQLENNLLVPRIMAKAFSMPPAMILLASVIGASLAGTLGILLSAPTMASLVLLGRYIYRKVFDLSPWDPPVDEVPQEPRFPPRPRWRRDGPP